MEHGGTLEGSLRSGHETARRLLTRLAGLELQVWAPATLEVLLVWEPMGFGGLGEPCRFRHGPVSGGLGLSVGRWG
jgi:hypothetical protein